MRFPSRRALSRAQRILGLARDIFVVCICLGGLVAVAVYKENDLTILIRPGLVLGGVAAFAALFLIGGRISPNFPVILYLAFIVVGTAVLLATGDRQILEPLAVLAGMGIFIVLPLRLVERRRRRRAPPPPAPRRLTG